jgi:hypothetical protein
MICISRSTSVFSLASEQYRLTRIGDWAFVSGTTVNAFGGQTRVGPGESADTAILWKIVDSEWQMITHAVGITDVAYASWPEQYGAATELIFPRG